jgi:hypothetical protein
MFWFSNDDIKYFTFEDVQYCLCNRDYIIINTLPLNDQDCLITNTINGNNEEKILNEMLYDTNIPDKKIIVYGKNLHDETTIKKINQLKSYGIKDIFVYKGGMFEWLLLQDIYGNTNFPTTTTVLDILKYRPDKKIIQLI